MHGYLQVYSHNGLQRLLEKGFQLFLAHYPSVTLLPHSNLFAAFISRQNEMVVYNTQTLKMPYTITSYTICREFRFQHHKLHGWRTMRSWGGGIGILMPGYDQATVEWDIIYQFYVINRTLPKC